MKIICLGDSLTYGYMLPRKDSWPSILEEISSHKVINKGINGDTTPGMLSRFQNDVVAEKPSVMILMGGTNDFYNEIGYMNVAMNIKTMIVQCNYYMIKPVVMVPIPSISVEPMLIMKSSEVNRSITKLREELFAFQTVDDFILIDLYSHINELMEANKVAEYYLDDIHLNRKGNEYVAKIIDDYLKPYK
ncbi:MAG: GDSL-type esterase/lipase family protein [Tissierellia bacterium]|nr:GDSL-type esterase/lipase family protein [Tissierellia bacterium]